MASSFENFPVYQKVIDFTLEIFKIIENENLIREYSLKDQLKRATLSISNNIAEGSEYNNNKQFVRFLWIAKGSSAEVRNMLLILQRLNKIDDSVFEKLNEDCLNIGKEIFHFIKYLERNNLGNK